MTVDSTKNTLYISQRAANAIIADVAPYRISSEALSAINTFLDEFLYFLIDSARSLDLIRIKHAIGQVLPTSLGKNAIGEAELELKTYVESGNSDHTKEKTIEITPFPLQKVFEQFRVKCQFFSTLGERGADDRDPDSVPDLYASEGIHIAPSLAIYLTAVLEYVGEYILILVAKASEKQGVEVARAREVYSALSEDSQIFPLFRRTNLKEQMQMGRESTINGNEYNSSIKDSINVTTSQLSTRFPKSGYIQSPTPRSPTKSSSYNGGGRQASLDESTNGWPTSPVKSPSDYGRQSLEHKNVGMRSTKSMQSLQRQGGDKEPDLRNVSSMEDNREKMRSFETLISSNQTMKVSLTPNRLITIETHKRPPKLAPREPVSRERIIQSNPTSPSKLEDFDDDDDELFGKRKSKKDKEESLWEFLKNTSPDDVLGDKVKKKRSKTPGSPGNNPLYTPLIPSSPTSPSSPYQSDRINATINQTLSSSRASDDQNQSRNNFSSLHHSKSLDQTQSSYYQHSQASRSTGHIQNSATKSLPPVPKPRPDPLDLIDDDDDLLYPQGQKKPKRRHEAQDLIDFLSTSPPKDSILNNGVGSLDTGNVGNVGKKKEKKLKKLLSKLKKPSFIDESTSSLSGQRLTNASLNSFSTANTYGSNSTASTLVNKPARYIKIEIPKIPPKEDNQEQSIFDQVEIQGRHARQISRASLSGSTRSLQYTPNRSTFSNTGGMMSPTILEKPNNKSDEDEYDEYMGITTDRSRKSQKSANISTIQQSPPTNTNDVPTYSAHKTSSSVSPRQKSLYNTYNDNVANKNNNPTSSQGTNKVTPALPKDQKLDMTETLSPPILAAKSSSVNKRRSQHISTTAIQNFTSSEELLSINNKNIINENEKIEVQTKPKKIVISKESIHNKEAVQTKSIEVLAPKELIQNKEVIQTKSKEVVSSKDTVQNIEVARTKSKEIVASKEHAQNGIVQIKFKEAIAPQELAQNKEIISHDSFMASIIEAEIIQDVQEEITIVTYNEEEELEEALVAEWLLGTGLTFKNAMTYVDIMQVYEDDEVPEMEKSEYEDADDTEFIDDRDDDRITVGNIVQVGA